MPNSYEILLSIGGKISSSLNSSVSGASKSLQAINKAANTTSKSFGSLKGALAGAASTLGVTLGFGAIVDAASKAEDTTAQLQSVLKSTGGVAGVTQEAAENLAGSLGSVTKFGKDTVLGSENMLLTFTKIGKDVMPQATETVLNMSQALGQDTKSSAIQLGKALNDPLKGITALQRVGVSFTEQQKKQIDTMVKVGDTAGAQKLILAELGTEFGGSARAAGQTFSGQMAIAQHAVTGGMIKIGEALVPTMQTTIPKLTNSIKTLVNFITTHQTDISQMAGTIANVGSTLLNGVTPVVTKLFNFMKEHGAATKAVVLGLGAAFFSFKAALTFANGIKSLTDIGKSFKEVGKAVSVLRNNQILQTAVTKSAAIAQAALNVVMGMNPIALVVLAIAGLIAVLVVAFNKNKAFHDLVINAWANIQNAAGALKNTVVGAFEGIWNGVKPFINSIIGGINFLIKGLNSIQLPKISLPGIGQIGGGGLNIPEVPKLAQGGIVQHRPGGIMANIGEGQYDEAVIPLKNRSKGIGGYGNESAVPLNQGAGGGMTVYYSPVFHIGSGAPVEDFKKAAGDSQRDFARQMEIWQRNKNRVSFG